jgi:hypothetical protein
VLDEVWEEREEGVDDRTERECEVNYKDMLVRFVGAVANEEGIGFVDYMMSNAGFSTKESNKILKEVC